MNKEKLIYLAAPYSHEDESVVDQRAHLIYESTIGLVESGYKVVSPIMYGEMLSSFVELDPKFDYWKDYCLGMLSGCDVLLVLMLEGWEQSEGVKAEIEFAEENGIEIDFAEVSVNLGDLEDETKYEAFCQEPLNHKHFDVDVEAKKIVDDMMAMVRRDLNCVTMQQNGHSEVEKAKKMRDAVLSEGEDVMIDIETLGTEPGSVILSIAAVRFNINTGEIDDKLFMAIDIQSCLDIGLNVDGSTLGWWMNLDESAREHLEGAKIHIKDGLRALSSFLRDNDKLWGNSARFDFGLLADAYTKVGSGIPWNFRNERDVRTLVSFKPEVKSEVVFEGIPHNPLDDCKHQINYCHLIWKFMNS